MKINNLKKQFPQFSLSIDEMRIPKGRIYGLIGPNGCGKTTMVKIIAGLLEADSGEIDYEGLTFRDITMVSRKPYFLHDSVYRNLIYPLKLRGIKPDRELTDYYLDIIGFKDRKKQYAPSLSNGEQQKLSLARALIFSPKLIVLDEAFSNLDIESTERLEGLLLERQREDPVTWLVISHQISHISRLCDYIFFMDDGKLENQGPVEDMLHRPQNAKLQQYLRHEALSLTEKDALGDITDLGQGG